ncbi:hypothetical protein BJF82_09620 [Kytococcus sp. CUA-901]|nr:hypothetical protein BJF82_09620 [Kytococcus sp. CUA-901]
MADSWWGHPSLSAAPRGRSGPVTGRTREQRPAHPGLSGVSCHVSRTSSSSRGRASTHASPVGPPSAGSARMRAAKAAGTRSAGMRPRYEAVEVVGGRGWRRDQRWEMPGR